MNEKKSAGITKTSGTPPAKSSSGGRFIRGLGLLVLTVTAIWKSGVWEPAFAQFRSIESRAEHILKTTPLIDGHNDLAILVRRKYSNKIYGENFTTAFEEGGFPGEVDIPRLKSGHYTGAFWSAFWLCQKDIFDFSDEAYLPIVKETVSQLDVLHRILEYWQPLFPSSPTADVRTAKKEFKKGKIISPLIIEGLHQIGNSFANLRMFYKLGVRYATLTWNCHNIYADAAVLTFIHDFNNVTSEASTPYWGGLSAKGRDLILEMNRMGMIVDLSHVSADTMRDVLVGQHNDEKPIEGNTTWSGSLAPPIFSHSSAYSVCPHPRNVPDDVLHMVKKRNSVVMINFSPGFISCTAPPADAPPNTLPELYPQNNTIQHVAKHIMHIGELIGYEHVGLGSDFDGIDSTPQGLEDVSKMPALVAELLRQGVSDADCKKVVGENLLRVWQEVEDVAKRLQSEGMLPFEDDPKPPLKG